MPSTRLVLAFLAASVLATATTSGRAAPPSSPPLALPPFESRTLPNGLRVVLAPDPRLDAVSVVVRYDVGSADDPPGREGLAHLVEHMMFNGTRHVPKGYFGRELEGAGGWGVNATTEPDRTTYTETVPPGELPIVLWLESDRMGYQRDGVQDGEVERERGIVLDEYRDRIIDDVTGALGQASWNELFPPWHPYSSPGDEGTMGGLSGDDVRAFLRTWYSPSNATLVIAGKFDPVSAMGLVQRYFSPLPAIDVPRRPELPAWTPGESRIDVRARIVHPTVTLGWLTPALDEAGDRELDLVATLLTGVGGLLRRELYDTGQVIAVHSGQRSLRRASVFSVSAVVAPGVAPETVRARMVAVVEAVAKGVDHAQVALARTRWATTLWGRLETPIGRAAFLAGRASSGAHDWDLARYVAVDDAAVRDAAQKWLTPARCLTVIAEPDDDASPLGDVTRRVRRVP